MNVENSCGEPMLGSTPSLRILATIAGDVRLSLIAALNLVPQRHAICHRLAEIKPNNSGDFSASDPGIWGDNGGAVAEKVRRMSMKMKRN